MEKITRYFNLFRIIVAKFEWIFPNSGNLVPVLQLIADYLHDIVRIEELNINDEEKCRRFYYKISKLLPIAHSAQAINPFNISCEVYDLCWRIEEERKAITNANSENEQRLQIPYYNYVNNVEDAGDREIIRHRYNNNYEQHCDEGYESNDSEFNDSDSDDSEFMDFDFN